MKQPTLDTLSMVNLTLFLVVVVMLFKLALVEDDNAQMESGAIHALHNLTGVFSTESPKRPPSNGGHRQ